MIYAVCQLRSGIVPVQYSRNTVLSQTICSHVKHKNPSVIQYKNTSGRISFYYIFFNAPA